MLPPNQRFLQLSITPTGQEGFFEPFATIILPLCGMETSHMQKNINRLPTLLYALCPLLTTFVKIDHLV